MHSRGKRSARENYFKKHTENLVFESCFLFAILVSESQRKYLIQENKGKQRKGKDLMQENKGKQRKGKDLIQDTEIQSAVTRLKFLVSERLKVLGIKLPVWNTNGQRPFAVPKQ